ncbi:MAG: hypothetical protein ACOCWW_03555 [Bacteroidota bacterium]
MSYSVNMLNEPYFLNKAVFLYSPKNTNLPFYAETRNIFYVEGKPVYGAGKPLSKLCVEELTKTLKSQDTGETKRGLLPQNLLAINTKGEIAWFSKAQKRTLYLQNKNESVNVNCPGFVFIFKESKLYIFTVKDQNRPTGETEIFQTPLWNILDANSGAICLGNNKIKKYSSISKQIDACENAFFNSYFSHIHEQKDSFLELWLRLDKSGEDFPLDSLRKNTNFKNLNALLDDYGF